MAIWIARVALLVGLLAVGGCSALVDTDAQRLCRSLIPALEPASYAIAVTGTQELGASAATGSILQITYRVWRNPAARAERLPPLRVGMILCTFAPATGAGPPVLAGLATDRGTFGPLRLHLLKRFWIDNGIAATADPAPVAMLETAPRMPRAAAIGLQHALSSLPVIAIYALLATAYSLIYGLIGRINLAFGDLASLAGYGAFLGYVVLGPASGGTAIVLAIAAGLFTAAMHGTALSRLVIGPLAGAPGQHILIATIGVSMVWQEGMRLTQGAGNRWLSPLINRPFGIATAGDFTVTVTPMALVVVIAAGCAATGVVIAMRRLRFGLHWRASADDPVAAAMMGIDQRAMLVATSVIAAVLAGYAGVLTTLYYGGVGYSGGLVVGLKALIAAIVGGIGSIGGALVGAVLVGAAEALWSATSPIELRDPVMFAALVLMLWWRPGGLFGDTGETAAQRR